MKRTFLLFAALFMLIACSKEDDDKPTNDPSNSKGSFEFTSADGNYDMSGTAVLSNYFNDSVVSVIMTNADDQSSVILSMYSTAGVWSQSQFMLDSSSSTSNQTFVLSMSINNTGAAYAAYNGVLNITDKNKNESVEGNFEVDMINPGTLDTISATGNFKAVEPF